MLNPPLEIDLKNFDSIVINSSGGKDSVCSIWEVCRIAKEQNYPFDKIVISHQDLGRFEWSSVKELVHKQAKMFGLRVIVTRYRNKKGEEKTLLDYVLLRGKWPSQSQRYCTSDFKRGPGSRVLTQVSREHNANNLLQVFGFRFFESPAREKKQRFSFNKRFSNTLRTIHDWLPIHTWSSQRVWKEIEKNNLPYHKAYNLGMPRLSCVFCIFSPFDALVLAGYHNRKLLDEYIAVELKINHTFRHNFSLQSVADAIDSGYTPKNIPDWKM